MDRARLCVGGGCGLGGVDTSWGAEEVIVVQEVAGLQGTSRCPSDGSSTSGTTDTEREREREQNIAFEQNKKEKNGK